MQIFSPSELLKKQAELLTKYAAELEDRAKKVYDYSPDQVDVFKRDAKLARNMASIMWRSVELEKENG